MKEIIFIVDESPEGGYEARALDYSIFTDGDDLEQLKANVKDAVATHFDADEMPKVIRLHMVKEIVIAA
ncbi:MAG: 2-oxoisovalerate dehydrogenase [Flavobacteriales bacterium]|nr:2-oxoisovalerate dehydrogenase [Flavobacteriales bacterium]MBK6755611.1 2-oxoisovalerate dehydrogenase [Flavobacteriales bacterium]MBK7083841.1 2-oxoisovalerate dehydrogenase [Flavobacteriales bacterium]MBK7271481.1 2-oxoisovalerate dehydrogenase [Flavobacteriales bacterium]MBK7754562.1 2-oxoisovalerate dehydrogenase [Flavobacteriales bacterium]